MEMETESSQAIAKKLWSITRVMALTLKKGFANKSKLLLNLTLLLTKRTNKLASKALHSLLLLDGGPHHPNSSCFNPQYYEFTCTTTPSHNPRRLHEASTMAAVHRVLDFVNADSSPAPGCRNLGVTDSPFPAMENEEVNKAADEFIRRFYMDLSLQKSLTVDSPFHDTWTS